MFVLMLTGRLWRVRYAAVLVGLLTAGCASVAPVPGAAQPPVAATQATAAARRYTRSPDKTRADGNMYRVYRNAAARVVVEKRT
jgi:hypothetical protein